MVIDKKFWAGRKVFVTGHTGFKGSWLSIWLSEMGAIVTGYSLPPPTNPSLYVEANVASRVKSIEGDIRDYQKLFCSIKDFEPSIIFHMAAQSLVRKSYQDPLETYSTNFMGTLNILEASRHINSITALVNITTDKCYQNNEWIWGYRENDRLGGFDPYSNSKACAELVSDSYIKSFFSHQNTSKAQIGIGTARAGNVIGGGDWSQDRLLTDLISSYEQNTIANIRNPDAIRPWQHVLEPLRGYLMLAEMLTSDPEKYSGPWNFGPLISDCLPVRKIANIVKALWYKPASWECVSINEPHEASSLRLDITKSQTYLGWHPLMRLEDGIKAVIQWHDLWRNGFDANTITVNQINEYMKIYHYS